MFFFQAKKSFAKCLFETRVRLLLRYSSLKTFYNLVIWSSRWLQTNIGKDCLLSCLSATFCPKIGKNSFCRQKVFFVGILETLSFCARKYGGWTSGRSVVKVVRCLSPLPPSNASLSSAVSEIWPKKRNHLPGKILTRVLWNVAEVKRDRMIERKEKSACPSFQRISVSCFTNATQLNLPGLLLAIWNTTSFCQIFVKLN